MFMFYDFWGMTAQYQRKHAPFGERVTNAFEGVMFICVRKGEH